MGGGGWGEIDLLTERKCVFDGIVAVMFGTLKINRERVEQKQEGGRANKVKIAFLSYVVV
jgi:hypothetical protein